MKIIYTPQFDFRETTYNNDIENKIIRVSVNGELIEHDLSGYQEPENTDAAEPLGFPIVGFPQYKDGILHVTLIKWYR